MRNISTTLVELVGSQVSNCYHLDYLFISIICVHKPHIIILIIPFNDATYDHVETPSHGRILCDSEFVMVS